TMNSPLVCIVDDDPLVHFITKKMLKPKVPTDRVLSFFHGKEAYDFLTGNMLQTESLPDIILLDINMPEMDGIDFLDAYNSIQSKLSKPIAIYVISSSMNKMELFKVKNNPYVRDFISKPLDKKSLETIFKS